MSSDNAFTLYYFNGRGRAEFPRLVLAYVSFVCVIFPVLISLSASAAGVKYTDQRVEAKDWAETYKAKMPYGQMPV
jgi:hypothetical protein